MPYIHIEILFHNNFYHLQSWIKELEILGDEYKVCVYVNVLAKRKFLSSAVVMSLCIQGVGWNNKSISSSSSKKDTMLKINDL